WNRLNLPGLQGFTIFRMSNLDSAFARVDTAESDATLWIDPAPRHFTTSLYRIAAVGAGGSEADTTGRAAVSVVVPPLVRLAGGAASTAVRNVAVSIRAEEAGSMILAEDSLLSGAAWEPFDTSMTWTFGEGKGTKSLYLRVQRGAADTSDVVGDAIETAATNGALLLAGGDSTTARARVPFALSGELLTKVVLSPDALFGDAGDTSLVFDSLTTLDSLGMEWMFGTDLGTKILRAQFWNEFGPDTVSADSVRPDPLANVSVLLAGGDSVANVCEVSLSIDAKATLMNLSPVPDFPPENWIPFRRETTWTIGDTAGTYTVWVQLSNDFVNLMESPTGDALLFVPVRLAIAITAPADSSVVVEGNTVSIEGSVVGASCRAAPDSVEVEIGDSLFTAGIEAAAWTVSWTVDEDPSDTTALSIVARTTDQADSTASDTVLVFVAPSK
ncbi:MAG: Ig-like domain-containing protein, partial [Candidatus Eisenbacteria bacterium]